MSPLNSGNAPPSKRYPYYDIKKLVRSSYEELSSLPFFPLRLAATLPYYYAMAHGGFVTALQKNTQHSINTAEENVFETPYLPPITSDLEDTWLSGRVLKRTIDVAERSRPHPRPGGSRSP